MKLIADSGSTKTAWAVVNDNNDLSEGKCHKTKFIQTTGINPFQQTEEDICHVLSTELVPELGNVIPSEIYFYGAGCTPEKSPLVASALRASINHEAHIEVYSDMLGAARGLCGRQPGLVAILGTGANSCYYNGREIIANVSPLGYILGDEGSGAYLGKRLVGDILKRQLPEDMRNAFTEETHETPATIIQKTYRETFPNRFLASLSPFCARHREHPDMHKFLVSCFREFFIRNISVYPDLIPVIESPSLDLKTVHFVGSIAKYYPKEITEAANSLGYRVGNVMQAPLEGLISFHD